MRALLNGAIHRKKHKNLLCHSCLWTGSLCRAPSDLKCRCTWAQAEPLHKYQTSFPHGTIKAAAHTETRCISPVICPKLYRVSEATGNKRRWAGAEVSQFQFSCLWGQASQRRFAKAQPRTQMISLTSPFYSRSTPFSFNILVLFWTVIINFSGWIMALHSPDGEQKY